MTHEITTGLVPVPDPHRIQLASGETESPYLVALRRGTPIVLSVPRAENDSDSR